MEQYTWSVTHLTERALLGQLHELRELLLLFMVGRHQTAGEAA